MHRSDQRPALRRGARDILGPVAVLFLTLALPSSGQLGSVQANPIEGPISEGVSSVIDWETFQRTAKLSYQFGGALMTNERARTIADNAGYTYLSWQICPGVEDCIMLEVEGKKGRIFQYMVMGSRCTTEALEGHEMPPGSLDASRLVQAQGGAASRVQSAAPRPAPGRTPQTAPGTIAGSVQTTRPSTTGGSALSFCFGGFTSGVRTRQHQQFFIDHQGHLFSVEQVFQFLIDGTWTTGFSAVATAWQDPLPNSGMTERGTAYEVRDASGKVLDGESESVQFIASSGAAQKPTLEQLCRGEEALTKSWGTFLSEGFSGLVYLLPIPTKFSGSLSLEPFDIGGTIGTEKEFNYSQAFRNMLLGAAGVASSQTYLDCLKNPGTYDPANFGPDPDSFDLEGVQGFEVIHPEAISFEGSCPITRRDVVEKDLAGVSCTITTDYSCHPEPNTKTGANDCSCTQTAQAEVCVSGGT